MRAKQILKYAYPVLALVCAFIPLEAGAKDKGKLPLLQIDEVVARVLDRPEVDNASEGRLDTARAEVAWESTWHNPEISYDREQLFGRDMEESEDFAALSQQIDISGRRSLRVKAAKRRVRAAEADGLLWRLSEDRKARLLFYRVLHAQLRAEAIRKWVERFESAVRDVKLRAAAGDASKYDRLRLQLELAQAKARMASEQSLRNHHWSTLAALIREPMSSAPWPRLSGRLTPKHGPPSINDLAKMVHRGPELAALTRRAEAVKLEQQAAKRWWIPNINLHAGYKTQQAAGDRAHGFVAGVSMPLPLFDRNRAERLKSKATLRITQAERSLKRDSLMGVLAGLLEETIALTITVQTLHTDMQELSEHLLKTTNAAYLGGELAVLELIDVYDRSLEAELFALDLEFATRTARINLDFVTGGASR